MKHINYSLATCKNISSECIERQGIILCCVSSHSSEIRGLCSMKLSRETHQNCHSILFVTVRVSRTPEQKGFVENNMKFPKIPLLLTISIPKWGFEILKSLQKPKLRHFCGHLAQKWEDRMPRCKYVIILDQSQTREMTSARHWLLIG